MIPIEIRRAVRGDIQALGTLYCMLHEHETPGQALYDALCKTMARDDAVFFLALQKEALLGFAECAVRTDYVEGAEGPGPVGYLEGVYVVPVKRRTGVARALCARCEAWAKEQGCDAFASDCMIDNCESLRFHRSVGFDEVSRNIHFLKKL